MKNRDLSWISRRIRQLAAEGVERGKEWSLAQLCEHLALAIDGTAREPDRPGPPDWWLSLGRFERLKRSIARNALLTTGIFPSGVPSPEPAVPTGSVSLEEGLLRLEAAVRRFEQRLSRGAAECVYHPLLGRMNGRSWRRFHEVHARHHFRFFVGVK